MSQDTRHLVRDQIDVLRDSEQLPFCDLLDEARSGRFSTERESASATPCSLPS